MSFDDWSPNLAAIIAVESFGRLGMEGSTFISERRRGTERGLNGEERSGEGTPTSNRLGDHKVAIFAEGIPLEALLEGSAGSIEEKSGGGGGGKGDRP